jgi:mannosylglucosylglycerate synthase
MRIGFVSTRLAGLDGVSLEAAKWVQVLKKMGHECFYCAGELDPYGPPGMLVPEMHFQHPVVGEVQRLAFSGTDIMPELNAEIQRKARGLKLKVEAFIEDFKLDVLVVQNALTIPMHISLGVALVAAISETEIPTIAHHHDFYWERERFLVHRIPSILRLAFPPHLPMMQHVVISTVMQRELQARRNIDATYIPNVFDFAHPPDPPDDYSDGFRADMGFKPDDVVFLQPTRLVARKSIERGIDLVRLLGNGRYKYVLTGSEHDEPGPYFEWLLDEAVRSGTDMYFIGDRIGERRGRNGDGEKVYRLWDVYPQADLVTYPSNYEGFGNALIETLYFRRPLVTNTYPVYRADIKPAGVDAIEINEVVTAATAVDVLELLNDPARSERMIEHNYQVGQEHFSLQVLERKLTALLEKIGTS